MNITQDDVRILFFLIHNQRSSSTTITKGISGAVSLLDQKRLNIKIIYRLRTLQEDGLVKNEGKLWSTVFEAVKLGEAQLTVKADKKKWTVCLGPAMILISGNDYRVVKLD